MKFLTLMLIFSNIYLLSQKVNFEKVFYRNPDNLAIQISVDNLKLDSINRIELKNNAILRLKNSSSIQSDDFFTDLYYDNGDNKFTIIFNSKGIKLTDIKSLEGTFKYFTPTQSNTSIHQLNIDYSSFENLVYEDSKSKIKIVYLDAFKIDSLKNNKDYLKKIIKNNDLDKALFEDAIKKHLKHRSDFKIPHNLKTNVIFYIENPTYKVVSTKFKKSGDNDQPSILSEHHSDKWTIWELRYFDKPCPKTYNVEVISENEDSVRLFDFNILTLQTSDIP